MLRLEYPARVTQRDRRVWARGLIIALCSRPLCIFARYKTRLTTCLMYAQQGTVLQPNVNVLVKPTKNSNTAHVLTLVRTFYTFAALRGAYVRDKIQLL